MDKNTKILISVLGAAVVMIGLSFAAVPFYNMFCKVTGYGGTTQVSAFAPSEDEIIDRKITIHFNTDTNQNLNWKFKPEKRQETIKIGEQGFVNFISKNKSNTPSVGTAIYNVTPDKAGKYFHKIQCFCFDSQTLAPNQEMNMPVVFYIDPSITEDRNLDDLKTITLSYTFYEADSKELDRALEEFYNAK